ncbi:hypothetical protein L1987_62541 [Smallanthus sonchifolius]|uniref:Uncharacterized protein n=1 Tax=Smallanthus sonchifolius TaxID=185202 RepID=A0ACB9CAU0_9ASTR|nr:hypothetical protein L1987_62541 [Smallanthus sonchifolius]
MDRNFVAVTIFTLLFIVSTARISLDLTPTDCKVEDSDLAIVPTYTKKSRSRRSPPFHPRPSSPAFFVGFFFCFYAIADHDCLWTMAGFMGSQKLRSFFSGPWLLVDSWPFTRPKTFSL